MPPEVSIQVNWLVGSWILDREKTVDALEKNTVGENSSTSLAGKLATEAVKKSTETLIAPLEKIQFKFTGSEYSEQLGEYRKLRAYEIIDRPAADQITIKDEKDTTITYHLDGKNIWYNLMGQERLQIYLKPASKTSG